jgi:hypothetical protein
MLQKRFSVAYVAMAIYVCCKCIFQTYVVSVLSRYCICCSGYTCMLQVYVSKYFTCFRPMLQVFHLDVAYFRHVASVYSKCFIYFRRMLQVCLSGCCSCYTYMLQMYVCKCFTRFRRMLQKCFNVATLAGVESGRMQIRSSHV